MSAFYISERFVNEVRKGSYESYVEAISGMLEKNASKVTGRENGKLKSIATFKNNAIAMDEECDLYRISFEDGPEGSAITNVEKIDSKKMDQSALEYDLMDQFTNEFINSIDNETIECKNKIRESFSNICGLKSGELKGYKTFDK